MSSNNPTIANLCQQIIELSKDTRPSARDWLKHKAGWTSYGCILFDSNDQPRKARVVADLINGMVRKVSEAVLDEDLSGHFEDFTPMLPLKADDPIPVGGRYAVFYVRGDSEGHYIHIDRIHHSTVGAKFADCLFMSKTFGGAEHAAFVVEVVSYLIHGI